MLIATGSEVPLAEQAAELLGERDYSIRVVSMPSVEIFLAQDEEYRTTVLGRDLPIATIEAGVTFGWERFSGTAGLRIGIDHFGTSAPASVIAEEWGFTPQAVADRLVGWLSVS